MRKVIHRFNTIHIKLVFKLTTSFGTFFLIRWVNYFCIYSWQTSECKVTVLLESINVLLPEQCVWAYCVILKACYIKGIQIERYRMNVCNLEVTVQQLTFKDISDFLQNLENTYPWIVRYSTSTAYHSFIRKILFTKYSNLCQSSKISHPMIPVIPHRHVNDPETATTIFYIWKGGTAKVFYSWWKTDMHVYIKRSAIGLLNGYYKKQKA